MPTDELEVRFSNAVIEVSNAHESTLEGFRAEIQRLNTEITELNGRHQRHLERIRAATFGSDEDEPEQVPVDGSEGVDEDDEDYPDIQTALRDKAVSAKNLLHDMGYAEGQLRMFRHFLLAGANRIDELETNHVGQLRDTQEQMLRVQAMQARSIRQLRAAIRPLMETVATLSPLGFGHPHVKAAEEALRIIPPVKESGHAG